MSKVFYTVPASELRLDEHRCPMMVFRCIDHRFRVKDQEAIEKGLGIKDFDLPGWPAPGKIIVYDDDFAQRVTDMIADVCVELHEIKKVLILGHWDCGGYGGSKSFASPEEEEKTYVQDLVKAQLMLKEKFLKLEILVAYSKLSDSGDHLEYHMLQE